MCVCVCERELILIETNILKERLRYWVIKLYVKLNVCWKLKIKKQETIPQQRYLHCVLMYLDSLVKEGWCGERWHFGCGEARGGRNYM